MCPYVNHPWIVETGTQLIAVHTFGTVWWGLRLNSLVMAWLLVFCAWLVPLLITLTLALTHLGHGQDFIGPSPVSDQHLPCLFVLEALILTLFSTGRRSTGAGLLPRPAMPASRTVSRGSTSGSGSHYLSRS